MLMSVKSRQYSLHSAPQDHTAVGERCQTVHDSPLGYCGNISFTTN